MLTSLSMLIALFALSVIVVGLAILAKVWGANSEEFAEARRMQGSPLNLISGELRNPPNEFGDFRIVRGLKWDRKHKKYIAHSALSSEGFRAAFPK